MDWICLLAICCSLMITPPSVTAASLMQSKTQLQDYLIYVPWIVNGYSSPVLLSPANGAVLDTLLPVFHWNTGQQPTGVKGCLSLSTQANTQGCNIFTYTIVSSLSERSYRVQENLLPGTVYFWRVGIESQHPEAPCNWSQEWIFTTGPAGGQLPPSPQLFAPPDNSILPHQNVVLLWRPIGGAAGYTLHWYSLDDINSNTVYLDASSTSYTIPGLNLTPGYRYEWWVKARSSYGYGPESEPRRFHIGED